jgi:hypothetical protein
MVRLARASIYSKDTAESLPPKGAQARTPAPGIATIQRLQRIAGNRVVTKLLESDVQRVFVPEHFLTGIVKHHFPNGGNGYKPSQTEEKMRREVQDNGTGGQDTGYGFKTKPVYHKSSGTRDGTSVSAFFTTWPTYILAAGEHETDTSYRIRWRNNNVALWNVNNVVGLNNSDRIDVASKADLVATFRGLGYPTPIQRSGGLLSWGSGTTAQANKFTVKQKVKCGPSDTTLYAIEGEGIKGVWERTTDSKDTTIANTMKT